MHLNILLNGSSHRTVAGRLLMVSLLLVISQLTYAYVTLPTTSYVIKVGEVLFLPTPKATEGYIDFAKWACSSPYIRFIQQDEAGAEIEAIQELEGTAVVEMLCVEKFLDIHGRTRSISYYKEFHITCSSEGYTEPTSIRFPRLELEVGDIVQLEPEVRPSEARCILESCSNNPHNSAFFWILPKENALMVRAVAPGTCESEITFTNGQTATARVEVNRPRINQGIVDDKGNRVVDPELFKAVVNMENLFKNTLHSK